MQRHERCAPRPYDTRDHGVHELDALGIEIAIRLVQQQNPRVSQDEPREREPALHPGRKAPHPVVRNGRQPNAFKAALDRRVRQSQHVCRERQVLACREVVVQPGGVRQVADLAAYAVGVVHDIVPVDRTGAGVRVEQRPEDPEYGALSTAVRSQQSYAFAALHFERYTTQHPSDAEAFAKTTDDDRSIGLAVEHRDEAVGGGDKPSLEHDRDARI